MPKIYSYQKYTDSITTKEILLPFDKSARQFVGTELATINNVTYVSIPGGENLPTNQMQEIASSIKEVTLSDELRAAIKRASPHVGLINSRVKEKIAEKYSISDEVKLIRTAPSQEYDSYNLYVEECRAWGREEKAKLGL